MEATFGKESDLLEILNYIKKYGKSFKVQDKNTIIVRIKTGDTKTYYLDDDGKILGSLYVSKGMEGK